MLYSRLPAWKEKRVMETTEAYLPVAARETKTSYTHELLSEVPQQGLEGLTPGAAQLQCSPRGEVYEIFSMEMRL